MDKTIERIPNIDINNICERDSRLEELSTKELVECIIDTTETIGSDLTKLNVECIMRGIVIQNNGIILGIDRKNSDG